MNRNVDVCIRHEWHAQSLRRSNCRWLKPETVAAILGMPCRSIVAAPCSCCRSLGRSSICWGDTLLVTRQKVLSTGRAATACSCSSACLAPLPGTHRIHPKHCPSRLHFHCPQLTVILLHCSPLQQKLLLVLLHLCFRVLHHLCFWVLLHLLQSAVYAGAAGCCVVALLLPESCPPGRHDPSSAGGAAPPPGCPPGPPAQQLWLLSASS